MAAHKKILTVVPSGEPIGAVHVLLTADIKAAVKFARGAILANVHSPANLDKGAQRNGARARRGIVAPADIRTRCRGTGGRIGLRGNRIIAGDKGAKLVKLRWF